MDNTETFLILKYGSLHKAYHMWLNGWHGLTTDEYHEINHFFAQKSLRERVDEYYGLTND